MLKNTTVTHCHTMIFNHLFFYGLSSRGSSSRKFKKMYGKWLSMQKNRMIYSATDFTVTTVTNIITFIINIIIIIKLLSVTVKIKTSKKAFSVTNCHTLSQTVTSLSHSTVTNYNSFKIIYFIRLFFIKNQFVTVKPPSR